MISKQRKIIEDLEIIKKRPYAFISPVTAEMLNCFISGIVRCYIVSCEDLNFYDIYRKANSDIISRRGWEILATSPAREMREKGMPEAEIVDELFNIEIETWSLIEESTDR